MFTLPLTVTQFFNVFLRLDKYPSTPWKIDTFSCTLLKQSPRNSRLAYASFKKASGRRPCEYPLLDVTARRCSCFFQSWMPFPRFNFFMGNVIILRTAFRHNRHPTTCAHPACRESFLTKFSFTLSLPCWWVDQVRGVSKKAGLQCVMQTVASRGLILPLPVVVLPAAFVELLKRRGMMPASPRARMWVQVNSLRRGQSLSVEKTCNFSDIL